MIEVTDQQLLSFAEEEQFFLFCDRDEFIDIAKAVLYRFAPPAEPDVSILTSRLAREFPRIDPDNPKPLDEEVHCCETVLYRERERLHEILSRYWENQGDQDE